MKKLIISLILFSAIAEAQITPNVPSGLYTQFVGSVTQNTQSTYYYWVQAVFPLGRSLLVGPSAVSFYSTLSTGKVVINWQPAPGAFGYDVLRTTTSTTPTGACNCAIGIMVNSSQLVDSNLPLLNYTVVQGNNSSGIAFNLCAPSSTNCSTVDSSGDFTTPGSITSNTSSTATGKDCIPSFNSGTPTGSICTGPQNNSPSYNQQSAIPPNGFTPIVPNGIVYQASGVVANTSNSTASNTTVITARSSGFYTVTGALTNNTISTNACTQSISVSYTDTGSNTINAFLFSTPLNMQTGNAKSVGGGVQSMWVNAGSTLTVGLIGVTVTDCLTGTPKVNVSYVIASWQ